MQIQNRQKQNINNTGTSYVKYNNPIKMLNYKDRNGGGGKINMFHFLKIIFYILQSFAKFSSLVCGVLNSSKQAIRH
jgi:hypothetical protein